LYLQPATLNEVKITRADYWFEEILGMIHVIENADPNDWARFEHLQLSWITAALTKIMKPVPSPALLTMMLSYFKNTKLKRLVFCGSYKAAALHLRTRTPTPRAVTYSVGIGEFPCHNYLSVGGIKYLGPKVMDAKEDSGVLLTLHDFKAIKSLDLNLAARFAQSRVMSADNPRGHTYRCDVPVLLKARTRVTVTLVKLPNNDIPISQFVDNLPTFTIRETPNGEEISDAAIEIKLFREKSFPFRQLSYRASLPVHVSSWLAYEKASDVFEFQAERDSLWPMTFGATLGVKHTPRGDLQTVVPKFVWVNFLGGTVDSVMPELPDLRIQWLATS